MESQEHYEENAARTSRLSSSMPTDFSDRRASRSRGQPIFESRDSNGNFASTPSYSRSQDLEGEAHSAGQKYHDSTPYNRKTSDTSSTLTDESFTPDFDRPKCRFCPNDDTEIKLITACKCVDGTQFAHRLCLLRAIMNYHFVQCESCRSPFANSLIPVDIESWIEPTEIPWYKEVVQFFLYNENLMDVCIFITVLLVLLLIALSVINVLAIM